MRFTATSAFTSYAMGTAKEVRWRCYSRKTSTFNTALSSGTWTELSDSVMEVPDFGNRTEITLGQFQSDDISMRGIGLAWWLANILNPSAGQRVEIKWECTIGLGPSKMASDIVYAFSGWVPPNSIKPNNNDDSVSFTVRSHESLGEDIPAEALSTQYIDPSVNGGNGLILPTIDYLYVTDCGIASYELNAGVHTLVYQYTGGNPTARLDDGEATTLTSGVNTLSNADDTERVELYTPNASLLPTDEAEYSEELVVLTSGDTLCRQWYRYSNLRYLLKLAYEAMGIDNVDFDTLQYTTNDSSSKLSFIDVPPNDFAVTGYRRAVVSDGTDLYIGAGRNLYKRTMATDTYTLLDSVTADFTIVKLWYNARNGHIWILSHDSTDVWNVHRYIIGTDTLSSAAALASDDALHSAQLMDFNYTGSSYKYGLVYADEVNLAIRFVPESTMTDGVVVDQAGLGYTGSDGPVAGLGFLKTAGEYVFTALSVANNYVHKVTVDSGGAWVNDGTAAPQNDGPHQVACYDPDEDRIYYWHKTSGKVKSHLRTGVGTTTDVLTLTTSDDIYEMRHIGGVNYWTTRIAGKLYTAEANTATLRTSGPQVYTRDYTLTILSGALYGIDRVGRLFKYHSTLALYVKVGRFGGKTVRGVLYELLNAFALTGITSTTKRAKVYRRGNDSGTAQTSGNTLALTTDSVREATKEVNAYPAFDLVTVSNGDVEHSYNGTTFDQDLTVAGRKLTIQSEYLPDELCLDLAYRLYQHFKTDRHTYTVEVPIVPLFQYEPFDACTAVLTDTHLDESISGVILGQTMRRNGSMTLIVAAPL